MRSSQVGNCLQRAIHGLHLIACFFRLPSCSEKKRREKKGKRSKIAEGGKKETRKVSTKARLRSGQRCCRGKLVKYMQLELIIVSFFFFHNYFSALVLGFLLERAGPGLNPGKIRKIKVELDMRGPSHQRSTAVHSYWKQRKRNRDKRGEKDNQR
jgi:hypothetical protein